MKVFTFPIIVHVAAETREVATNALTDAGLQDGEMVFEQDGKRVPVMYVNVDEGAYGEVQESYDTDALERERAARHE